MKRTNSKIQKRILFKKSHNYDLPQAAVASMKAYAKAHFSWVIDIRYC